MERNEIESKLKELRKELSEIEDQIASLEEQRRTADIKYPELVGKYFRYVTATPENSWKNGAVFYVYSVYGKRHYTDCTVVKCAAAYPHTGTICTSDTFDFDDSYEDDASAFTLEEITEDEFTRTLLSITDAIIEKTCKKQ